MLKIPIISSDKAVRAFSKLGYQVTRQRDSHIRLHNFSEQSRKPLSIPRHKSLGKGLLRKLFRDANISLEEFLKLL